MVYVIILTFQYLTGFSDIRFADAGELQDVSYISRIKEAFIQNFNASNSSSNGDFNKVAKDMNFTKNFFRQELLRNGINFDSKFLMFSNGFETGDFSKWTSVYGSPEIADVEYDGSRGMYCNNIEYVNKTLPGLNEAYVRAYVNFRTLPLNARNYFIGLYEGSNRILILALNESNGNFKLRVNANPTGQDFYSPNIDVHGNEWHYFELYWYENSTNSKIKVWYDGVLRMENTTDSQGQGKSIDGYMFGGVSGDNPDMYIDCAAVSPDYIGNACYPEEQYYFVFNLITNKLRTVTGFRAY
jgi:hypothetical protein